MALSPLALGIMDRVARDEQQRVDAIKAAWESYYARTPKPLKSVPSDEENKDNTLIPYTRLIVNTVNSWLFGSEPAFNLDKNRGRNEQEAWLDSVWAANRKMVTLAKHGKGSAVAGHGFLKLQKPGASPITGPLPRVIVLDAQNVTVTWDEEDVDVATAYRITWPVADLNGRPGTRRQRIERDGTDRWHITDEESRADANAWTQTNEEDWPFKFAPIVDAQHLIAPAGCYYGESEIDAAIQALNDQLNFGFSNSNRVVRVWGHPKLWVNGAGDGNIDQSPDSLTLLPSPDAQLHALETNGTMSDAYEHIDRLLEQLLLVTRVPLLALGEIKSISKQLSGTALSILFLPLLQHVGELRLTQEPLLQRLNGALLALGGQGEPDGSTPVTVQWPELLPGDMLQERQAALLDQQLGVSRETILEGLGYDPDQEAERSAAEATSIGAALLGNFDRGAGTTPPNGTARPMQMCPDCQGQMPKMGDCPTCGGTGTVPMPMGGGSGKGMGK